MTSTIAKRHGYGSLPGGPIALQPPSTAPQFIDPFGSSNDLYVNTQGLGGGVGMNRVHQSHSTRSSASSASSFAPYSSVQTTTAASVAPMIGDPIYDQGGLQANLDLLRLPAPTFTTASSVSSTFAPSPVGFDNMYNTASYRPYHTLNTGMDHARRFSQPNLDTDVLEATQGMISMKQDTPRGPYAPGQSGRGSTDSYNFPTSHSPSSSISSSVGNYSTFYSPVDSSAVSDYSTAGSDIEGGLSQSVSRRQTLLNPPSEVPAQVTMMGQFSSKVSSSTQKKHKCKICEKRFTRPSSLQTHMYSHTGEKPFACDVEGCGRHFSVVSNLRRHKKVHRTDEGHDASDTGSPQSHHSD